jgi:trans-2,3-dihydro-3-hydroxyanthranilate isomerase
MFAYLIDAFTDKRFEGNPAGVVLDADSLTKEEKQKIASEIHASETAFVSKSTVADYKVEFFTPITEVDFCGHNTIAAFWLLAQTGKLKIKSGSAEVTQETRAGILPVSIESKSGRMYVTMKQRLPQFASSPADANTVARALNLASEDLDSGLPIKLSNTGNWSLMVPVKSAKILDGIQYDASALSTILSGCKAITANVFCRSEDGIYRVRNFCPTVGIPEDPATGSAAGAFAAYLANEGVLGNGSNRIQIRQGEAMGRPSDIAAYVHVENRSVTDVRVSGTATFSFLLSSEMPVPVPA